MTGDRAEKLAASDPAATLQALADHYRALAPIADAVTLGAGAEAVALAEHVEGVIRRNTSLTRSIAAVGDDIAELLAVAAAAGIKP